MEIFLLLQKEKRYNNKIYRQKGRQKMKVYGSEICIDCRNYLTIQKMRGFESEFIDITADTGNLKEFLRLRDTHPIFEPVREHSGIGIRFFVNEDGKESFDLDEALAWLGQEPVGEDEKALLESP